MYVVLLLQSRSAINRALEETGESDPQALDKNYWISKVGEVSRVLSVAVALVLLYAVQ